MSEWVVGQSAGAQLAEVMERKIAWEELIRADAHFGFASAKYEAAESEFFEASERLRREDGSEG